MDYYMTMIDESDELVYELSESYKTGELSDSDVQDILTARAITIVGDINDYQKVSMVFEILYQRFNKLI